MERSHFRRYKTLREKQQSSFTSYSQNIIEPSVENLAKRDTKILVYTVVGMQSLKIEQSSTAQSLNMHKSRMTSTPPARILVVYKNLRIATCLNIIDLNKRTDLSKLFTSNSRKSLKTSSSCVKTPNEDWN